MDIKNKTTFILSLIIFIISIITIIFPSAIVYYPFHQTPIFMDLHYFGAIILLVAGTLYLINGIKENKKIMLLGFGLGIVAWSIIIFSNTNILTYLDSLNFEYMMLQSRIAGLQGALCLPGPNSYLMTRSRIAIFHTFLAFSGIILGIISFILNFYKKKK